MNINSTSDFSVDFSLNDRTNAENTVALFSKALEEGTEDATIRAAGGCTGFTFLCNLPKNNFVLKRISVLQAENEQLCSNIFRRLELKAPSISILGEQSIDRHLLRLFKEKRPIISSFDPSQHCFIYMEQFPGKTFKDFFEQHDFSLLEEPEQNSLFETIGKVAIYDLAIGNNDRLVNPSGEDFGSPKFNAGNLLLNGELIEGKLHLKDLFFIDNATYASLEKDKPVDDSTDPCAYDLFGEVEEEEEEKASDTVSISVQNKMESFQAATLGCLRNLDSLVNHVYEGMRSSLPVEASEEFLKDALSRGVGNGIHQLIEKEREITALNEDSLGEFSKRTFAIFESVIQYLTNPPSNGS